MRPSPLRHVLLTLVTLFGVLAPLGASVSEAQAAAGGFVTRSGSALQLDGRPFRFAGSNMYWLQLDDNVRDAAGQPTYPTHFRIDDAMRTTQVMGGTVVRAWANSVGSPRSIQPALGTFNQDAFESLDYAIASASRHNQRMILTLVDNWNYYNGGKPTYVGWRGRPEPAFFSDPQIISDYLRHIDVVTSHVNRYTGIAYRDDPTIMGWETGNEMWCQGCAGNFWDGSWTRQVADHLKQVAPRQLVVDGHGTDPSCTRGCLHEPSLDIPSVDIVDDHHYPMTVARVRSAAATAAAHGRAYLVGEYDWVGHTGGDPLSDFLAAIRASGAAGALMWAVIPHADTTGFVDHNDGFQYFFPGRDSAERTRTRTLMEHARSIRGAGWDTQVQSPVALSAQRTAARNVALRWRGSPGAGDYLVQRRVTGGSWVALSTVTDQRVIHGATWTDSAAPAQGSGLQYRVLPRGIDGGRGPQAVVSVR